VPVASQQVPDVSHYYESTVAILAQGTNRADALMQAFLLTHGFESRLQKVQKEVCVVAWQLVILLLYFIFRSVATKCWATSEEVCPWAADTHLPAKRDFQELAVSGISGLVGRWQPAPDAFFPSNSPSSFFLDQLVARL
jgi:hypothetical protein